jgi:hypothetical protein
MSFGRSFSSILDCEPQQHAGHQDVRESRRRVRDLPTRRHRQQVRSPRRRQPRRCLGVASCRQQGQRSLRTPHQPECTASQSSGQTQQARAGQFKLGASSPTRCRKQQWPHHLLLGQGRRPGRPGPRHPPIREPTTSFSSLDSRPPTRPTFAWPKRTLLAPCRASLPVCSMCPTSSSPFAPRVFPRPPSTSPRKSHCSTRGWFPRARHRLLLFIVCLRTAYAAPC